MIPMAEQQVPSSIIRSSSITPPETDPEAFVALSLTTALRAIEEGCTVLSAAWLEWKRVNKDKPAHPFGFGCEEAFVDFVDRKLDLTAQFGLINRA
jgi:hypothetical protein